MLTIDIGNSRIKWALFDAGVIQQHGVLSYDDKNLEVKLTGARLPDDTNGVAISCVAKSEIKARFVTWLEDNNAADFWFVETRAKQCGIINSYDSPECMGVDRWLAMIAAYNNFDARGGSGLCVIDCGTAITLDFIGREGMHLGGLIMPGYQTMLDSLFKDAANIQRVTEGYRENIQSGLASSTQDAVIKGCTQLIVGGVTGVIQQFEKKSEHKLNCVVTGGDGGWVSKALTCTSSYNPWLVLEGLNLAFTEKN
jgi:type III pantothenate kinase